MSHRVSIYDFWDELQRDPSYADRDSLQDKVDCIWAEIVEPPPTFSLNAQLVAIGLATDPVFRLISVLCGVCGLSTYESGKHRPTGWSGQKFADRCHLDLEIDLDELEKVLQKYQLHLPKAWFPDETDEPQKKADLEAVTMVPDAVTEESSVPVLCFYKKGEHWWIGEKGNEKSFNDLIGLWHIHFLLKSPNKNFRSTVVYHHGRTSFSKYKKIDEIEERHRSVEEGNGDKVADKGALFDTDGRAPYEPRLDEKGYAVIRARIRELKESLRIESSTDPHKALEIKQEKEKEIRKLEAYLQEHGKGRKMRDITSQEERARKNVSNAIDRALSKIHELVPSLNRYLNKHTIKKGDSFSYKPLLEDQPDWILHPKDLTS